MADTGPQPETTYPIQYPLTTIWVAPTDCPAIIRTDGPEKCRPPEYDLWYSGYGYYSPGVCPYGYSVGCSETSGYVNSNAIEESETAGFCVPRYVGTSITLGMYKADDDLGGSHVKLLELFPSSPH